MLDGAGAGGGWARTGESFRAWPNDATAPFDTVPVCRLVGKPGVGPADHVYSSSPTECAAYKADPAWIDEGIRFRVRQPVSGGCPVGHELVTRLSKAGNTPAGSRHRYIADPALVTPLVDEGWKVDLTAFCTLSL